MREPPVDLPDDTLRLALSTRYGLTVAELAFLPLGHDSSAWVYRVRTDGGSTYFLKVRKSLTNVASLQVPRYLHDQGVTQVVAPLFTTSRTLWTDIGSYALILYPFVAGTTGMDHGMESWQWIAYGALLRQIHDTAVTPELTQIMRRETFVPYAIAMVRDLDAVLSKQTFDDSMAQVLATFWQAHREDIHTLVRRSEVLGRRLAQTAPAFVLCHADIHTANLLLDDDQKLWIVDWDETMLAPKERDVMFAVGGGISRTLVGPHEEELFLQGYAATVLDPLALAYYRHAWAVNDIGEYAAQVLSRPDLGPVSRPRGSRDVYAPVPAW